MDIEEYVEKHSRADRTKHINLNTPCQAAYALGGGYGTKKGAPVTTATSMRRAINNLREHLNLSGKTSNYIQLCHLCDSNTKHGVCVNPEHLYFGTSSENLFDRPKEVRKAIASKGGKVPNTQSQKESLSKIVQCPHCGKQGKTGGMRRWHFDRCKLK